MSSRRLFTANRTYIHTKTSKHFSSSARQLSASPWTQDGTIKSPFKPIEVPSGTLYDYVWHNLDKWPERTMAVCGLTGRGYTYSQGFKLSAAFAANLRRRLRVRDGAAVAVMLPNTPDYPVVALGVLGAGATITSINPGYRALQKRKLDFRQGYGLTETSPVVCLTPKGLDNYSCVGPPLPSTELKIVDQDLKTLGPNEVCGLTNRSYTYAQLYKYSKTLAANLRKKFKIIDGDTVGILSPNTPDYPIVALGALEAGATVTTLNHLYTSYEIQSQIKLSGLKLMFVHPTLVATVKEAFLLSKKDIPIICLDAISDRADGTVSFKELIEDVHADLGILKTVKVNVSDVALLPYSSGTTGLPKGVELTHGNIVANCAQQDSELKQYDPNSPQQETQLLVLPMYHSYGLSIAMLHKLSVGMKLVVLPRFQPDTFLPAIRNYKANIIYLAPPMVLFLGSHPAVTPDLFDSITCLMSGAAPLPRADLDKLFDKAKREVEFCQGYGLTETSPLATVLPLGAKDYKTVGYALPNSQLRIVDREMNNLGPNKVGELLIKGPNVMKGYKNNPEANKTVFTGDGWLRTGDLGSIDEDGRLLIADRIKELIKVKGHQVPPAELEDAVKQHPAVFDAGVIGVPDSYSGETPKAYVVLKDGVKATHNEIMDFVNERVAPYKRIKELSFIDSIPKNPSGKILRRVLRDMNNKK